MPFTSPLALLGLLFVPAVLAMYLLKLRRDEAVVPSTLLWTRLVADVEANAPWQRLRRSLLLLLQLLLVAILALLAARPFLERPAGLARDVVLVLDTSASMAATDVTPSRLEAAKAAALDALRDMPTGGKAEVYLDGKLDRAIDVYPDENSTKSGEAVWHAFGLKNGSHTVRLVASGQPGPGSQGNDIAIEDLVVFR